MSPEGTLQRAKERLSQEIFFTLCGLQLGKADANAMEPVTRKGRGGQKGGCGGKCVHPSAHGGHPGRGLHQKNTGAVLASSYPQPQKSFARNSME